MRVLVLGAGGMLGTDVVDAFGPDAAVATDLDTLDITDRTAVFDRVDEITPELVVNCAAYTVVARAEQEEAWARRVNAEGPQYVAEACARTGVPLIHVSTDYVFDGREVGGYREDATRNPINAYGRTKAAGEEAIAGYERLYLVRTSWLFGQRGPNFVETMLRLGRDRDTLRVVSDQIGCPTYTRDLAACLVELVGRRSTYGIYHAANSGSCSWYDFASEIMRQAGLSSRVLPVTTEEYGDPTPRPRSSILLNTKLPPLRPWRDALAAYLADR